MFLLLCKVLPTPCGYPSALYINIIIYLPENELKKNMNLRIEKYKF